MKVKRAVVAAAAVLATALVAVAGYRLARTPPADATQVVDGEVVLRVVGPGSVQARVPVTVSARISAQVVELHADHGDRVRRGQLLAVLDDRDLSAKRAAAAAARESIERNIVASEASVAKAQADLELARSKYGRDKDLMRSGFISPFAYDSSSLSLKAADAAAQNAAAVLAARRADAKAVAEESRFADTQWSYTRLVAPMDAIVIQRAAEIGSTVSQGTAVFKLVDPKSLWVAARIDESLVGRLVEGMPASIRLRSGEVHAGRVARISRQSDAATRELEVNVAFDSPPERFAIDQEAQVSIDAGTERGPTVPVAALRRVNNVQGVMVLRDGRPVFQPVQVRASDGERAVISAGVAAGDRIAAWTSR